MHIAITTLVVFWSSLGPTWPGGTGDPVEKLHQAILARMLAESEPALEKTESAIKTKKFIAEMATFLGEADQIDLLRLNPKAVGDANDNGNKVFHGYEILAEVRLASKEERKEAAAFLGKTFHWNDQRAAVCFIPRHGLRATVGKRTLDFLICFECWNVRIFEEAKGDGALVLGFTEKNHPIERLLADHEKKSKERK